MAGRLRLALPPPSGRRTGQPAAPLHSGFDRLDSAGQRKTGSVSGATSTSRLRARPAARRGSPQRARPGALWWTPGAVTAKPRCLPASAGGRPLTFVQAWTNAGCRPRRSVKRAVDPEGGRHREGSMSDRLHSTGGGADERTIQGGTHRRGARAIAGVDRRWRCPGAPGRAGADSAGRAPGGHCDAVVADTLGVDPSTVYRARRRFVECGLEWALSEDPRPGSVVCFDETPAPLIGETRIPWPAEPGEPARFDCESRRNGTANPRGVLAATLAGAAPRLIPAAAGARQYPPRGGRVPIEVPPRYASGRYRSGRRSRGR